MSEIRRYHVFAGYSFYPGGGWYDHQGSFDTLEQAQKSKAKIIAKNDRW